MASRFYRYVSLIARALGEYPFGSVCDTWQHDFNGR